MPRESFDEQYETELSAHVLEHGLPPVALDVELHRSLPVAYWRGPELSAVMHLRWAESSGEIDDYLFGWVHVLARGPEGWREVGRFETGEFDHPPARPDIGPRAVERALAFGSGHDDVWCSGIAGAAGHDAAFVEVLHGESAMRRPLDSPIGVFVACWPGRALHVVRVLDAAGNALFERPVVFPELDAAPMVQPSASSGITGFSGRATAALSDGAVLGEVFVMLQRFPEWDVDGQLVLVDGAVAYDSWWGYLEFLAPVSRRLMRRVEDCETVLISRARPPRPAPPGDPIRVTQVMGGEAEGRRRFLVHEAGDAEEV